MYFRGSDMYSNIGLTVLKLTSSYPVENIVLIYKKNKFRFSFIVKKYAYTASFVLIYPTEVLLQSYTCHSQSLLKFVSNNTCLVCMKGAIL